MPPYRRKPPSHKQKESSAQDILLPSVRTYYFLLELCLLHSFVVLLRTPAFSIVHRTDANDEYSTGGPHEAKAARVAEVHTVRDSS